MITVKDEKGHSQVWPVTAGNSFRASRRIQMILSRLKPHSQVLELGCGTGDLTLALLEAGHSVVALDRSALMIDATAKTCAGHANLTLKHAEISAYLRDSKATFDAVVGMGILHHCVLDLENTLGLISKRLNLDGRGLFWEPNRQNPLVRFLFGTSLGRKVMKLEPEEDAFNSWLASSALQKHFARVLVETRDWAYPFIPPGLQKVMVSLESAAPSALNNYVSQSLWIEFYKS